MEIEHVKRKTLSYYLSRSVNEVDAKGDKDNRSTDDLLKEANLKTGHGSLKQRSTT